MKLHLKTLTVALIALFSAPMIYAGTPIKKAMPKVEEEDILIKVPNRIYYFDDYDLHCYNTKNGTDTHIDDYSAGKGRTEDYWYDPATDYLYLVENGSGTMIANLYVYRLGADNVLTTMIGLTGSHEGINVDVTDDYVYLNGWVEEYMDLNIPGIQKNQPHSGYYTKQLKPWKMTKHSLDTAKKPDLSFYEITSSGVNVRIQSDQTAPRLGYFKTKPGYEEESYMTSEDAEMDSRIFTRAFTPWHPKLGAVFASPNKRYRNEGWTGIIIEDEYSTTEGQISKRFVKEINPQPLTSPELIEDKELRGRVGKMKSTKYPGVWLMIGELPDCGEAPLFIGKETDGMVSFKWLAGWPLSTGEPGKRIYIDQSNYVNFGKEVTKNDYELDLSKINDSDLETLFNIAEPLNSKYPILVNLPGHGVKTFQISE